MISLIAAVDELYGLGKNNQLLCHLPADLQHFKSVTLGKPIIMGRKTFESIGKALPGRMNIVISRNVVKNEDVIVAPSLESALELTRALPEVMIIGGASIYAEAIHYATKIYLTVIHHQFDADVFFPVFDKTQWNCLNIRERTQDEKNKYSMTFYEYQCLTNSIRDKFKINEKND